MNKKDFFKKINTLKNEITEKYNQISKLDDKDQKNIIYNDIIHLKNEKENLKKQFNESKGNNK